MKADELIDSYVTEVARLLPRKQRHDVAMELRVLLQEEIDSKAGPSNRDDVARAYLSEFGRPAEVAARYGSPVSLIDPADTRRFLILATGGVAFILLGGLLRMFTEQGKVGLGIGIQQWWLGFWTQAVWWLGALTFGFGVAAWVRRRWPQTAKWKPRPASTGRINRPGRVMAIVFFVLGTVILINPAWFMDKISGGRIWPGVYDAFAYDEDFYNLRGPILLGLLVLALAVQVVLAVQGRWRAITRQADLAMSLLICAALTWIIASGPVFRAGPTDQAMRGAMALAVVLTLIDVGLRIRRYHIHRAGDTM